MVPEDVFEDCCSSEDEWFEDCPPAAEVVRPPAAPGADVSPLRGSEAKDETLALSSVPARLQSRLEGQLVQGDAGGVEDVVGETSAPSPPSDPGASVAVRGSAGSDGDGDSSGPVSMDRVSEVGSDAGKDGDGDDRSSEAAGNDGTISEVTPASDVIEGLCSSHFANSDDEHPAVTPRGGASPIDTSGAEHASAISASAVGATSSEDLGSTAHEEEDPSFSSSLSATEPLRCDVTCPRAASSSESSPAEGSDWHVLEQPSPVAPPPDTVQATFTSASAAQDLSETLAEAHDLSEVLAEACGGAAPEKVADGDAIGGDGDAAAAPEPDVTEEPELVADPDAIDEEALRLLDESQTEDEREARRAEAGSLKADGNQLYASSVFDTARERYTAALRLCPLSATRDRAVLFSNRAACRARAADETGAVADCGHALRLDPDYVKPLQRRAELLYKQEKLDDSLKDWERLLELQPSHPEARRAVATLPAEINERNEKLKTEMFAKLKDLGNMILRPFNLSTENFQLEQNDAGGYSVKFNQA